MNKIILISFFSIVLFLATACFFWFLRSDDHVEDSIVVNEADPVTVYSQEQISDALDKKYENTESRDRVTPDQIQHALVEKVAPDELPKEKKYDILFNSLSQKN